MNKINMNYFSEISLLITHYNRAKSLENLLESFHLMNCRFGDIIVSDDGSKQEHIDYIRSYQSKYSIKLITAPVNKGLGNNINKGQDAVITPFTLYIQEDFEPLTVFPDCLQKALTLMEEDDSWDLVRFYAYFPYPYLRPLNDCFSEMSIKPLAINYDKIYVYSDHPHLRRSTFFEKFGRYPEGLKGDRTEYKMCISFIQNRGKGLFCNNYRDLFIQRNTEEEPSTMMRTDWKSSRNIFMIVIRYIYRQIKYNYDILLMKSLKE